MTLERCPLAPRSANIIPQKHEGVVKQKAASLAEDAPGEQKRSRTLEESVSSNEDEINNENSVTTTPKHQKVTTPKSYRKSVKRVKHDESISKEVPHMKALAPIDEESKNTGADTTKLATAKSTSQKAKLLEWKRQYKKAFPNFRFYLDGFDPNLQQRVKRQVVQLGGHVETFFSGNVTHVVTTRSTQDIMAKNSKQDVLTKARQLNMKIWSMEKLCNRVLKTLLEDDPFGAGPSQKQGNDLSYLLYVEKVQGTNERDLSVPRQDFVHFKGPYLYVHDMANVYKPILLREWPKPSSDKDVPWPTFRATSIGRCPFVPENKQRLSINAHTAAAAAAAKAKQDQSQEQQQLQRIQKQCSQQAPPTLSRANSFKLSVPLLSNNTVSTSNSNSVYANAESAPLPNANTGDIQQEQPSAKLKPYRMLDDGMQASGIVQSNLTSAVMSNNSNIRSGSAAGVPVVAINGRDINELKKRIIQQKSGAPNKEQTYKNILQNANQRKVRIDPKPGYCENCREKFDNFELHIRSRRHRKFAENDENFKELDELFELVQRPFRPL
ncbi:Hsk1-Dfp1 kinase complex regulatory subunit Dfp1 [Schizosaccharomyces cryophilus OY26]|uniref:Hsk1-Dfp1 kinase complex regulatory subunit Dfp1 n=1 Tax=Schizosaccharomyces cryophilus (strain OY26 / ATCC MYA-4695 / CBS 11777 / NBRC 106824 / NRRL Y48691) TaxID=653667 RepID=S9VRP7_SCHCR|nr:Hsk1-Dfp1 kinase complex regulatory subunit Dfp1 [Schizosaccharomyces cryophilus OY26]EPY50603.1 Hsk1-Dfp1 kinase complex regulatory subunit Dfp1 [Schizosaccharomyces cryophilus OY26]